MKRGYIYSIFSAILFGSAGLLVKMAFLEGVNSIELLTLQYIIAVILMLMFIYTTNKKLLVISRNDLFKTAVLGIIGNTFMTVFYYYAFDYLQVSIVAILLYTYPTMVFLYQVIFQRSKVDGRKVISLILAFIGCYFALGLAEGNYQISIVGLLCGLLSAVFFSFMNIYSENNMDNLDAITINFYSTVFSLISLVIYRFPSYLFSREINLNLISYTALLAVVCEIIPLTLLYAAIKKIGSFKVSIIGNLEIPTAMILSYVFLGETMTFIQILGAAMVIYAVYTIKKEYS